MENNKENKKLIKELLKNLKTEAVRHIEMIQADIFNIDLVNYADQIGLELLFWGQCKELTGYLDIDEIFNHFLILDTHEIDSNDLRTVVEGGEDIINDIWEYVQWERETPFVAESVEIIRILLEFLTYKV